MRFYGSQGSDVGDAVVPQVMHFMDWLADRLAGWLEEETEEEDEEEEEEKKDEEEDGRGV